MVRAEVPGIDFDAALAQQLCHLTVQLPHVRYIIHALGDAGLVGDHGDAPGRIIRVAAHSRNRRFDQLAVLDAVHVARVNVDGAVSIEQGELGALARAGKHALRALVVRGHTDVDETANCLTGHQHAVADHFLEPVVLEGKHTGLVGERFAAYQIGPTVDEAFRTRGLLPEPADDSIFVDVQRAVALEIPHPLRRDAAGRPGMGCKHAFHRSEVRIKPGIAVEHEHLGVCAHAERLLDRAASEQRLVLRAVVDLQPAVRSHEIALDLLATVAVGYDHSHKAGLVELVEHAAKERLLSHRRHGLADVGDHMRQARAEPACKDYGLASTTSRAVIRHANHRDPRTNQPRRTRTNNGKRADAAPAPGRSRPGGRARKRRTASSVWMPSSR